MNVLNKNVPTLDYNDPQGSLKKIYDYLYEIMEQIDYTLSRQGIQLGKVNLPATATQVKQLEGQLNGLSSSVAVLAGTVSVVNGKADKNGEAITALEKRIAALEGGKT